MSVTIFGYGSLLSEKSSARSFKSMQHRRLGVLPGYKRVFALGLQGFAEAGFGTDAECGVLALRPLSPGEAAPPVVGVLFDISQEELEVYHHRERAYDIRVLPVVESCCSSCSCVTGTSASPHCRCVTVDAVVALETTDAEVRARLGDDAYVSLVGDGWVDRAWGWNGTSRTFHVPPDCWLVAARSGVSTATLWLPAVFTAV